jgi:hypothetical protein
MRSFVLPIMALLAAGLIACVAAEKDSSGPEGGGVVQTGQATSQARYDDAWFARHGVGRSRSFVDNNDGTVTDKNSGLVWVKDPSQCGGRFGRAGAPTRLSLKKAAEACEQLSYARRDDWRLPTVEELSSLVNAGRSYPAIDTDRFPGCMSFHYWTSTPASGPKPGRWLVDFATGFVRAVTAEESAKYVRPVRVAATPTAPAKRPFVDNGDGTVTDKSTGLIWVRDPMAAGVGNRCTWPEAVRACAKLKYASSEHWRLPNRNELQSLVDYTIANPCLNATYFVTESDGYWTSTSAAENKRWAWAVGFDQSYVDSGDKNYPHFIRPVRSGR